MAGWLTHRVAPSGRVLATDIKPGRIPQAPCLDVVQHDIVREPLTESAFDLIHARLVLLHLPERLAVLAKLVHALRPGVRRQGEVFHVVGVGVGGDDVRDRACLQVQNHYPVARRATRFSSRRTSVPVSRHTCHPTG